jgi:hypothetical protein
MNIGFGLEVASLPVSPLYDTLGLGNLLFGE